MLVISGQNTRRNDVAPVACLSFIDQTSGENSGCSGLELDGSVLPEVPGKRVLVISNGDDALNHESSGTGDSSNVSSGIGMLPSNTGVLIQQLLRDFLRNGNTAIPVHADKSRWGLGRAFRRKR